MLSIFLKELVRRAIVAIRRERFTFEAKGKIGYDGVADDLITSADLAAQAIYEKLIRESLPGIGIIGEEGLNVPCTLAGIDAYITIDPLDGTKAYGRRQSHGTATMVALVIDGEVVASYIGDVNTEEVYGFRPGTRAVQRISEYEIPQRLDTLDRKIPLGSQLLLLREFPHAASEADRAMFKFFKNVHIDSGSIGIWFTRLWKGEVGALLMEPDGHETPWDSTPIMGISKKLGFKFLRIGDSGTWEVYEPVLPTTVVPRTGADLVIHESALEEFFALIQKLS